MGKKRKSAVSAVESQELFAIRITGLPNEATERDVAEFCRLAGALVTDEASDEPCILIRGKVALVPYLFRESLAQAMLLLDEATISSGSEPVKVELLDGTCDDSKRLQAFCQSVQSSAGSGRKRGEKGISKQREKAQTWEEGEERVHVVVKNLFDPALVDASDLDFYADLREELKEECETFGEIESLKIFEDNPLGVVAIKFADWLGADRCIRKLDGRMFDGRILSCEYYDGETDYRYVDEEREKEREKNFEAYLE